jgi:membrane fusion protein (multidrug efflux system)
MSNEVKQDAQQAPAEKKKSPVRLVIIAIVLAVGGTLAYKQIHFALTHETTDDAQIETQITPVLPRVAGYVKSIAVKDYDSVHANQLLVELDDAELQTQLLEMQADYVQSQAEVGTAQAALNNAVVSSSVNKGNIDINQVHLKKAQEDYQRDLNLFNEQAITKRQLDDSKFNLETAQKQVENSGNDFSTAQSRIGMMKAGITKAQADLAVKKAKIDEVKLKLTYTKIYAPVTGKIGKKNVSEGQYVQAGAPLFSIVNDTTFWIVANFKESQLKKLYPGKEVDIEVDAYPDLKLKGTILSLSEATGAKFSLLPPDNASGNFVKVTQRVPVKVAINDVEKYKQLRAGISVTVTAKND